MTYANLFSKLLKEDLKRRIWAVALTFLAFFFSLPVGLALAMEKAENTDYRAFNSYNPFFNDGSLSEVLYREKLLSLRTDVVMSQAGFGYGIVPFLLVAAAVIIGVSSFSYLHNRQKVDFYHSIPVRREVLFGSRFMSGILMTALAYGINLLLMTVVALTYGVSFGTIAGPLAGGWLLNMLYFVLLYGTVVAAMLMTGNMVVGILATGIFFFFLPGIMLLLAVYCETFFVATARDVWTGGNSPFLLGIKYLSPFSIYMTALSWNLKDLTAHVPELLCSVAAIPALILLALQLYRIRPSEAAGKAMAFRRSRAPIRMIMVIGFGLSGGLFFWALQSRLKWGLFGVIVSAILAHCVIEIIYSFDFRKLFSHKLQLGIGLVASVLVFLSFRYDWYGYDSYIPKENSVASVSLDIENDHDWSAMQSFKVLEDGTLTQGRPMYEYIEENMKLTDMDAVMAIVKEGRDRTLAGRELRLEGFNPRASREAHSFSVIGGADGPTSIFVAGKLEGGSEDEGEAEEEKFYTTITVCYELKNGRRARREYQMIPLSVVMDDYSTIYSSREYKTGNYDIMGQNPGEVTRVLYQEADRIEAADEDRGAAKMLLEAYQADLLELSADQRMKELPVGKIGFVTDNVIQYMKQESRQTVYSQEYNALYAQGYGRQDELQPVADNTYFWPVYPSFTRTIELLKAEDILVGTYFIPENMEAVTVNVQSFLDNSRTLPRGEELEAIKRLNPYYREKGYLEFKEPENIAVLMKAIVQEENFRMNFLYNPEQDLLKGFGSMAVMQGGTVVNCVFTGEQVTPELLKLFVGIPVKERWTTGSY